MLSLHDLQARFFDSLARKPGAGPDQFESALVECVEGRGQLGAEERIDIYAQMYYARLFDVMKGDFPRVTTLLGCERAHELVSAYLAQHPSRHPSLRHLGRFFPTFLQQCPETKDLPFLGDLAALEWNRLEVFDAPDIESLRIEHLQQIAPDEWPVLRFQLIPAFQMLQSAWPVHTLWKAVEEDVPDLKQTPPAQTVLRIWRSNFMTYHAPIDVVEQTALDHIVAGESFAEVCAAIESLLSPEEAASSVGSLLLCWVEDGILTRLPSRGCRSASLH